MSMVSTPATMPSLSQHIHNGHLWEVSMIILQRKERLITLHGQFLPIWKNHLKVDRLALWGFPGSSMVESPTHVGEARQGFNTWVWKILLIFLEKMATLYKILL